MDRAQQIRELGDAGRTCSEIAVELGVSRQRIHALAKEHGIVLRKHSTLGLFRPSSNRGSDEACPRRTSYRGTKPRIQTGGAMIPLCSSATGTISELLVAADLLARGWQAYLPVLRQKGHDILAVKDGRVVSFEVRSAYRRKGGALSYGKTPGDKSDVYALVVTGEPVTYVPDLS